MATQAAERAQDGLPAQGQLVTVRNRPWIVADVLRSSVASSDPHIATGSPEHLVTLVSVEDDARDEELRVVWELEPGAVAHEQQALPSPEHGFDDPESLDAFLDAVRWGAIASADKTALQAPFRSGIEIAPYQLDPVVRALSMPRTNLLIADDVGLGKTIEAGLVMQELMLRHRARTMLIVCPASLTLQWRDEMRDKFGLDFRIVDSALLKDLRRTRGLYTNPWSHYPRLIVSIDWLKRTRPMRLLRELLPPMPRYPRAFDLLVVDEVHTCAPAGRGAYAVDSLRTTAIRELAPHCEHRLFLSATPHNGYRESFTALLELLDDQRFARGVEPTQEQLARAMVRRLKSELPPRWDGSAEFPERRLDYLEVDYSAAERTAHELLTRYAASRSAGSGRAAPDFVVSLLKKRLFSSPKAFAETVETHLATMSAKEDAFAKEAERAPGAKLLRPLIDTLDETADDDEAYGAAAEAALTAARQMMRPLTAEERDLLKRLLSWARDAQDRPDAKFSAFRAWLDPLLRPGGEWNDERVIVFSEYRDTQRWLHEQMLAAGYPVDRIELLYGGQDRDDRERIKTEFTEAPGPKNPVRILLATDAASEGINLQRYCHRVLHWEIPWNPNRLEQRNGRVDRHGQPADKVEIRHFVPRGWESAVPGASEGSLEDELAFLWIAARKVDQIREDLGSAGDIIAARVEEKMLGKRVDWRAADTEIAARASRARLKVERDLARDLSRLYDALHDSRTELNLTPATVERVVRTALRLAHRKDLIPAEAPDGVPALCFRLPELPGAWAQARNDGLLHPLTGEERPVTFDTDAVKGRTDVVLLHLGSRLVQMCMRLLRAELWANASGTSALATGPGTGGAKLSRVTARVVPGDVLRVPAVVAHGRVVITGSAGTRLHEEIVYAGGLIETGRLAHTREAEIAEWLAAASEQPVPSQLRDKLTELWPALAEPLRKRLANRAEQRKRSIRILLEKRCEEEVTAIEAVLDELERSIQVALGETTRWQQPTLFEDEQQEQRDQLRKDHEALKERQRTIPGQRADEAEALRRRYADPKERSFPVSVTFLVPAALAHAAARGNR
ncbi:DISARM system SNF2-like helicase DrmD [Sphaerisporangium aureirubrum]|uniref:DISARM system SNF2-like helicase DrmD n=1 Tax=Sphaerisporangium aureirubrum TaxID=1544736 RepID=A0ABW1NBC1_9ACTN